MSMILIVGSYIFVISNYDVEGEHSMKDNWRKLQQHVDITEK